MKLAGVVHGSGRPAITGQRFFLRKDGGWVPLVSDRSFSRASAMETRRHGDLPRLSFGEGNDAFIASEMNCLTPRSTRLKTGNGGRRSTNTEFPRSGSRTEIQAASSATRFFNSLQ